MTRLIFNKNLTGIQSSWGGLRCRTDAAANAVTVRGPHYKTAIMKVLRALVRYSITVIK